MKTDCITERAKNLDRDDRAAYRVAGDDDDDVSTRVIQAIEEIGDEGGESTWLYDSIAPEAIDAIVDDKHDGTPRTNGKVVFTARGFEVVVHSDGSLTVYAPAGHDPEGGDA